MEASLLNEKRMKRKKLEEILCIKGDIFSDDDISLTSEEKRNITVKRMSASTTAKSIKEAELVKMRQKLEGVVINKSESDESEEESDDLTDSGSEEIDDSCDENDDDETQLKAMIQKAKETTARLQAEHMQFAGDYNREKDSQKNAAINKKTSGKMAGGDAGGTSSTLRRKMRPEQTLDDFNDEEEDIFIKKLKQKEKELNENFNIDKIPFMNDPARLRSGLAESSSDTDNSEETFEKLIGQASKGKKPAATVKTTSGARSATKKPAPAQRKNLTDKEFELKKKFDNLKKLLPPSTDSIESTLKKIKKPGNEWISSQEKEISKKIEQLRSSPSKTKPSAALVRPTRVDSANATVRGRPQVGASTESPVIRPAVNLSRNKSPTVTIKKTGVGAGTTGKALNRTPAVNKLGGVVRMSDLDSEPVRDLSESMKRLKIKAVDTGSSSTTGRTTRSSGKKLETAKNSEGLLAKTPNVKSRLGN